jgi:type IV secretory pathway VirB3-like protein
METLQTAPVFRALTQPQMFAGVTYSFFVINLVVTTEIFLITRSGWSLLAALVIHAGGYLACLYDPGLTHRSAPSHLLDSAGCRTAFMPPRPERKAA